MSARGPLSLECVGAFGPQRDSRSAVSIDSGDRVLSRTLRNAIITAALQRLLGAFSTPAHRMNPEQPTLTRVIGGGELAAAIFNITVATPIFRLHAHQDTPAAPAAPLALTRCSASHGLVAPCCPDPETRMPHI